MKVSIFVKSFEAMSVVRFDLIHIKMGKCLNFILDITLAWSLAHTNTIKDAYAAFSKRNSLKKGHRLDIRYYQNDDETVIIDGAAERS